MNPPRGLYTSLGEKGVQVAPINTDGPRLEALPRTTLLVDDVEGIRRLYRAVLEEASRLEVVGEAADGREAVEAVEELEPDLVLLDISMPEMDGLEALEQIKDARPQTVVVIVSALLEERVGDRAREQGAAGYLEKEGDPAALVPRLEAALGVEGHLTRDGSEGRQAASPESEGRSSDRK